jgi:hypothetical protein
MIVVSLVAVKGRFPVEPADGPVDKVSLPATIDDVALLTLLGPLFSHQRRCQ